MSHISLLLSSQEGEGKKQLQGLTRLSAPADNGEQLSSIVAESSLRCQALMCPLNTSAQPWPFPLPAFWTSRNGMFIIFTFPTAGTETTWSKRCAPAPHSPSLKSNCQHRSSQGWFVFLVLPVQSVFYTISPALSPNTPMLFNSPSPFLISFSFFFHLHCSQGPSV